MHPRWEVKSDILAAGIFSINTVIDPNEIMPGPFGTQVASVQIMVVSVTRAAIGPPIITVPAPLFIIRGIGGCGITVGTGAAGWIGA